MGKCVDAGAKLQKNDKEKSAVATYRFVKTNPFIFMLYFSLVSCIKPLQNTLKLEASYNCIPPNTSGILWFYCQKKVLLVCNLFVCVRKWAFVDGFC